MVCELLEPTLGGRGLSWEALAAASQRAALRGRCSLLRLKVRAPLHHFLLRARSRSVSTIWRAFSPHHERNPQLLDQLNAVDDFEAFVRWLRERRASVLDEDTAVNAEGTAGASAGGRGAGQSGSSTQTQQSAASAGTLPQSLYSTVFSNSSSSATVSRRFDSLGFTSTVTTVTTATSGPSWADRGPAIILADTDLIAEGGGGSRRWVRGKRLGAGTSGEVFVAKVPR